MTQMIHLRDVSLRFEIWDTAGQEKYHSVTPLYYRGAHAALLVYDISKRVREVLTSSPDDNNSSSSIQVNIHLWH